MSNRKPSVYVSDTQYRRPSVHEIYEKLKEIKIAQSYVEENINMLFFNLTENFSGLSHLDKAKLLLLFRRKRENFIKIEFLGEPAWDILLDLYICFKEKRQSLVKSTCSASNVPATTALRWIRLLEEGGLIKRLSDSKDKRKVFIFLTDAGVLAMESYLSSI